MFFLVCFQVFMVADLSFLIEQSLHALRVGGLLVFLFWNLQKPVTDVTGDTFGL